MTQQRKKTENQTRELAGEIRAVSDDENNRTYEMSFSSEVPVVRWFGKEILDHSKDSVDLSRLKDVGVVLFSHGRDANYGKLPIASIDKVWLDEAERKIRAKITFDDDEKSEVIHKKVKKGLCKGVSFGYSVSGWEDVMSGQKSKCGRYEGPCSVGIKWTPYEISIEPVPADPTVGIGRSEEEPEQPEATKTTTVKNDFYFNYLRRKYSR